MLPGNGARSTAPIATSRSLLHARDFGGDAGVRSQDCHTCSRCSPSGQYTISTNHGSLPGQAEPTGRSVVPPASADRSRTPRPAARAPFRRSRRPAMARGAAPGRALASRHLVGGVGLARLADDPGPECRPQIQAGGLGQVARAGSIACRRPGTRPAAAMIRRRRTWQFAVKNRKQANHVRRHGATWPRSAIVNDSSDLLSRRYPE